MKKARVALITLLVVTLAYIAVWAYCHVRVYAEMGRYGYKDGLFIDPKPTALGFLRPYTIFLDYTRIGFPVLTALWIVLGVLWIKAQKHNSAPSLASQSP